MIGVVLVAAGCGSRMHGSENKVFIKLEKLTMVERCLRTIDSVQDVAEVVVVTANGEAQKINRLCGNIKARFPIRIVHGGITRQASVYEGLKAFQLLTDENDIVLVHDCARPLATKELFQRVAENTKTYGATIAAVSVKNTIKMSKTTAGGRVAVAETIPREQLWSVQTPQGFPYKLLQSVYKWAEVNNFIGTDDASLAEGMGVEVSIVEGEYRNIKITTPDDVEAAEAYLNKRKPYPMRVGYGYDVHRFKVGRPCILGGVAIKSKIGPDGHSDADVLLHALMDALLGAAGLRDIGYYFPPNDDSYKGISSMILLEKVKVLLYDKGLQAYNADVMVIAEEPKIGPYVDQMIENISIVLDLPIGRVSVKATTNEKLGALGRSEGIAAQAVVTVIDREE